MNLLFDIAFPDATKYVSMVGSDCDSKQYVCHVLSVSGMLASITEEGIPDSMNITITLDDTSGKYRTILQSPTNKLIYGINVIVRQDVTAGTIIRQLFVIDWSLGPSTVDLICSDEYGQMENNLPAPISVNYFPASSSEARGKPINYAFGTREHPTAALDQGKGATVKCYLVKRSATARYLICKTTTDIASLDAAYDPDGNDISGASALVTPGGADPYHYVNHAGNFDYILVNFTSNIFTCSDLVDDCLDLFTDFTYDSSQFTTMVAHAKRHYQFIVAASNGNNPEYLLDRFKQGRDVLKDICTSFNAYYYISSTKQIVLKILDYESLTPDDTFQKGEIIDYHINVEKDFTNQVTINFGYNAKSDGFGANFIYDHLSSQARWGTIKTKEIDCPWLPWGHISDAVNPRPSPLISGKWFAKGNQNPYIKAEFTMNITKWLSRNPGDLVKFPHPDGITATPRLYHVKDINFNFMNDTVDIKARDITEYEDFTTSTKLLIHSHTFNGSRTFINDAVGGNMHAFVIPGGTVAHSTTQKKFGDSSIRFNGNVNDYMTGSSNVAGHAHTDWDILDQTDATIGMWIRRDGDTINDAFLEHYEDANNYWLFNVHGDDKLAFDVKSGGGAIIALAGGTLNAATWYWVTWVKVGTEHGLYIGVNQVAYVNDTSTDNFAGQLLIGEHGTGTLLFTGYVDEPMLTHNNFFGAAPDVGLTDTITIPTGPYDDFGNCFTYA